MASNLTLIHFDSHPDLGIPRDLPADSILDLDALGAALSIENWILPQVYAGHIGRIVWIRAPWSTQIAIGKYELLVGKEASSGCIRCNCRESYFVSDMLYANASDLLEAKAFTLFVCDLAGLLSSDDDDTNIQLKEIIANGCDSKSSSLVLDIDLDFFSTQDPFLCMFPNSDDYEHFKSVYTIQMDHVDEPESFDLSYNIYLERKRTKLALIYEQLTTADLSSDEMNTDEVARLARVIRRERLDAELLHDYGAGIDQQPLPHHVSSQQEIAELMDQFSLFLAKYFGGQTQPGLVTIARSSLDHYCPPSAVDAIQETVLAKLAEHFKDTSIASVFKPYLDELE